MRRCISAYGVAGRPFAPAMALLTVCCLPQPALHARPRPSITVPPSPAQETARIREFDYVVVNWAGRVEEAAAAIAGIIDAEKRRAGRAPRRGGGGGSGGAGSGASLEA